MNRSTLPRARAHAPGWAHPYEPGPWSPVLYADGDDEDHGDGDGPEDDAADGGDEDQADGDDGVDGDADPEGADALGDKGKRALASMKGKWRTERDRRRELEAKLAERRDGEGGEDALKKAAAEATRAANARILRAEIRAAAKGKLADPRDALTFLSLDQFEVGEDGDVDADEIEEAIDDLIKNKPYLAAATAKRFQGTGDGGAARKASRPKQLTKSDLKSMTPEDIDKAREDGRLDDLMNGK